MFQCAWKIPDQPQEGIDYLYLTSTDFSQLKNASKIARFEIIEHAGEERYKICDIIGMENDLGVECLKGSALIAGETVRAYNDIFTITLVTCRSVGIGAYLVRLAHRSIQVEGHPIILTGAPALNKVLGREVYTSNLQLGGTQVMHANGVSHLIAKSDLDGASKLIEWLSFVPTERGAPPPNMTASDPWDRVVSYTFSEKTYDPRDFLTGTETKMADQMPTYVSGFFDEGSFQETLAGWAKSVVCPDSLFHSHRSYSVSSGHWPSTTRRHSNGLYCG